MEFTDLERHRAALADTVTAARAIWYFARKVFGEQNTPETRTLLLHARLILDVAEDALLDFEIKNLDIMIREREDKKAN